MPLVAGQHAGEHEPSQDHRASQVELQDGVDVSRRGFRWLGGLSHLFRSIGLYWAEFIGDLHRLIHQFTAIHPTVAFTVGA